MFPTAPSWPCEGASYTSMRYIDYRDYTTNACRRLICTSVAAKLQYLDVFVFMSTGAVDRFFHTRLSRNLLYVDPMTFDCSGLVVETAC